MTDEEGDMRSVLDRLRAVERSSVVPAGLSRPSVEAVVYAVTAVLLLVGPATTAAAGAAYSSRSNASSG